MEHFLKNICALFKFFPNSTRNIKLYESCLDISIQKCILHLQFVVNILNLLLFKSFLIPLYLKDYFNKTKYAVISSQSRQQYISMCNLTVRIII